jgi:hypothetical protein
MKIAYRIFLVAWLHRLAIGASRRVRLELRAATTTFVPDLAPSKMLDHQQDMGRNWTTNYQKVCADTFEEIAAWASQIGPPWSCGFCTPG